MNLKKYTNNIKEKPEEKKTSKINRKISNAIHVSKEKQNVGKKYFDECAIVLSVFSSNLFK